MGLFKNLGDKVSTAWQNSVPGKAVIHASDKASDAWHNSAVGQAAIHVQDKAKDLTKEAKSKALMVMFLPLMSVAKVLVKRKGLTPSDKPEELLSQVVQAGKTKSFGAAGSVPDSFDSYVIAGNEGYGFVDPVTISAAIQLLISIVSSIKKKKESGEKLTTEEQAVANDLPNIEAKLNEAVDATKDVAAPTPFQKYWKVGLVILLIIALVFFLRRK